MLMYACTLHDTICCYCRYGEVETLHATSNHRECFLYLVQRTVSFVEIKNTINLRCRAPIQTFDCGANSFTHNAVRNRNVLMCCTTQMSPINKKNPLPSPCGGSPSLSRYIGIGDGGLRGPFPPNHISSRSLFFRQVFSVRRKVFSCVSLLVR